MIEGAARAFAPGIEFAGALIIIGYIVAAAVALRGGANHIEIARMRIGEGVLAALALEVAATLLKTVALHTWSQFGLFAVVFAIRTVVGRFFRWEQAKIADR